MKVILTHEEVLEACVEWALKHHRLEVEGKPEIRVTTRDRPDFVSVAVQMAVEYPSVRPMVQDDAQGPYRTSG